MSGSQTVTGAYAKIEAHEDLCAERYRNINTSLTALHSTVRGARTAVVSVGLALIAWLASQVYEKIVNPPEPPPAVTATATSR